jgi:hypothetical protein
MIESLRPDETELVGAWVNRSGRVEGDVVCARIESLARSHLKQIALDPVAGTWLTLFIDPADGRYWERTYPHSEWHGGGPARLSVISRDAAMERYGPEIVESNVNA